MVSHPTFTKEQIATWASFGPPPSRRRRTKPPSTPEELDIFRERKGNRTAMKKELAIRNETWSERAIERELDRLVELFETKDNNNNVADEYDTPMQRRTTTTTTLPAPYQRDNQHPDNIMDHREDEKRGPLLNLLWCHDEPPLQGQTLYLGGEVGCDGNIYCIPGHAPKVLKIDTRTNQVSQIGPNLVSNVLRGKDTSMGRLYKWLRGIVVGEYIYGLPCHADEILKIHVPTQTITKLAIPYEEYYNSSDGEAKQERETIWKYHGGAICPLDNCIYAIPQRASQVLKFDPTTETVSFHGPKFPGRCKWYGGIVGKQDGAIYGIPQNASGVLRITPEHVTVHGDFGTDNHKWHGGAAAANGVIVSVPANSDTSLCITPIATDKEPILTMVGNADTIKSGRHRSDGKYKYLGAMCGANGKVYIFPCASEYVLQVDTERMIAKNVGPNLRDSGMEAVNQNKWQNGLTCVQDQCVYGMPLSGHTLLRIDCSNDAGDDDDDPEVTVWTLPSPRRDCRDKFEGGVMTDSGVMYTVPNNHKAVLRIEPANL
eukprot:scaffold4095_cov117-Cylindrotheca_fusiformis.AAC.17